MILYKHVVSATIFSQMCSQGFSAHLSIVMRCDHKFKVNGTWLRKLHQGCDDVLGCQAKGCYCCNMTALDANSALQASIATYRKPGLFHKLCVKIHDSGPYHGIFIRQRFGLVGLWLEMCQAISRQLSRAKMLASTQMCLRWCVAHLSRTRAGLICCGSSAHHHVRFNFAMQHSGFLMTNLTQVC